MTYDLIILGGGPAGYLAAERAGHAGMKVLCIEQRELGGVCLNEGCVPTKTLLYSAKLYDGAAHGEKYGVIAKDIAIDHAKVVARKEKVVKTLVGGVKAALRANHVETLNARGVITGRNSEGYTVEAGGSTYTGARLLICTGSSPAIPPIPGLKEGLESGFAVTNRELLSLTEAPRRLVVIGGGAIGSEITVIEMLDHIAGENDRELVGILQKHYEKRGMKLLLSAKVTEIADGAVRYEKDGKSCAVECDKVLISIGRRPNIKDVGLESIGVLTERGAIVTDSRMRTNQPEVYAAGDVNGRSMLAHTAYREAEVAVNTMLGKRDNMRYDAIPAVLYTNPELSGVGYTEAAAAAAGLDARTVTLPMRYSGRYVAENEGGDGIFKLVVNNRDNTILGAQALCNYSSEFIIAAASFIEQRLTLDDIKEIVFPHPTVSEIIREAVFQA